MAKRIDVEVRAKGAKKAGQALGGVDKRLKGLAKSAGLAAAGFFGARALLSGFKEAINLAGIQEQAEKKLAVALGGTSQALLKHASALQQVTTFGDEAIIGVQASLAAFIKNEDQIKLATEATLDMAVAMGMDLKAAGDLVAKTLGSSTNAMSRYGIQVEGAVGSTERLESLTNNVARLFGGQARAQADTMAGALQQMENAVGDAGEAIGTLLSPVVIELAKDVEGLAKWWGDWLHKVEGTKPSTKAESEQTKELSEEVKELTNQIEYRLEILGNEETLRKRALAQGNSVVKQKGVEMLAVANMRAELMRLNKERKESIILTEEEAAKPEIIPMDTSVFDDFIDKQQKIVDLKAQEAEWMDVIKEMYPELAEGLGLNVKAEEAGKKAKEDKLKLLQTELKQAALVQGSAEDAMKAVVRAESMEAAAGLIASILKNVPFPINLVLAAGAGAATAKLIDKGLASFAQGGDFITSGPQMIMVGDNPSGRERVTVTPSEQGSGKSSITINISAPLVDETVIDTIIPAIERARRLDLA